MKKYVIYHKFGGYLMSKGMNFTDNPKKAMLFDTKESAEIEIPGYLYRVEEIEID